MSVLKFRNGFLEFRRGLLEFSKLVNQLVDQDYYQIFNNMMTTGFCSQILKCHFNKWKIWAEIREIFPDFCLTFLNFSLTLGESKSADAKFLCQSL